MSYHWHRLPHPHGAQFAIQSHDRVSLYVVDKNEGGRSVTNDAAELLEYLESIEVEFAHVIYRDSMGGWGRIENGGVRIRHVETREIPLHILAWADSLEVVLT